MTKAAQSDQKTPQNEDDAASPAKIPVPDDTAFDFAAVPVLEDLPGGFVAYTAERPGIPVYANQKYLKFLECGSFEQFFEYCRGGMTNLVFGNDVNFSAGFGENGGNFPSEMSFRVVSAKGKILYVGLSRTLVRKEGKKSVFYDYVTDLKSSDRVSMVDHLTGLFNMSAFIEQGTRRLAQVPAAERGRYCIVYFDIENFNLFNQRFGFTGGSNLLVQVARKLKETFPLALLSRFADDHFVMLTEREGLEEALRLVHAELYNYNSDIRMELKSGIYIFAPEDKNLYFACDNARLACLSVKHHYEEVMREYDETLRESINRRKYIADNLEKAMENGYIKTYYQPVMRVVTHRIACFEALSRWFDPDKGLLSPADFIDTLEQYRIIHKLDLYMLNRICFDITTRIHAHLPVLPVSFNLSRLDFELCDMVDEIEKIIRKYDMPRTLLHVEITESAINDDSHLMDSAINRLRSLGYALWMDDFGSGYASLSVLRDYDFKAIKFDLMMMRDLINPQKAKKTGVILVSAVNMAKHLGVKTIGEGVETQEQFDFLRSIGCDKVQGYLISKPIPLDEIDRLSNKFENFADSDYYDNLGRVHFMNQSALEGAEYSFADAKAMAVFEVTDGTGCFLASNDAFLKFLRSVGITGISGAENYFNHGQGRLHELCVEFLKRCAQSQSRRGESIDFVGNGENCNIHVRFIAHNNRTGADMFLLVGINFSQYSKHAKGDVLHRIGHSIFKLFDRVDFIDVAKNRVSTIYLSAGDIGNKYKEVGLDKVLNAFEKQTVFGQDAERMKQFFDLSTLSLRTTERERRYDVAVIRVKSKNSVYAPKVFLLVPCKMRKRRFVLSCVMNGRVLEHHLPEQLPPEGEVTDLLDALLELPSLKVFWKGRNLRFRGANRGMLDLLGLESLDELTGRTDAEVGRLVDLAQSAGAEQKVLTDGISARLDSSVRAQGLFKKVQTEFGPVIHDGKIVGVVASVTDLGEHAGDTKFADEAAPLTDLQTGVSSQNGLKEALIRFEYAFAEEHTDFALVSFRIENLDVFRRENGDDYCRKLERLMVARLNTLLNSSGVIAHNSLMSFSLLTQIEKDEDIEAIINGIEKMLADLHDKNGRYDVLRPWIDSFRYGDRQHRTRFRQLFDK